MWQYTRAFPDAPTFISLNSLLCLFPFRLWVHINLSHRLSGNTITEDEVFFPIGPNILRFAPPLVNAKIIRIDQERRKADVPELEEIFGLEIDQIKEFTSFSVLRQYQGAVSPMARESELVAVLYDRSSQKSMFGSVFDFER